MKIRLAFVALLGFFIFYSCQNEPNTQQKTSPTSQQITQPQNPQNLDTLFLINEQSPKYSFYMTGSDVSAVQVIGIEHKDEKGEPGVSPRIEERYNWFWDLYFQETGKDPKEIALAMEFHFADRPDFGVGSVFGIRNPKIFITPHMFSFGMDKVVVADFRDKSRETFIRYQKAIDFFSTHGGAMKVVPQTNTSLPKIEIIKEPTFTDADILWLKNEWYEKVHLPDLQFEDNIVQLYYNNGYVGVVGLVHALRLNQERGMKVALIDTEAYLNSCAMMLAQEEYYLKVIGKK